MNRATLINEIKQKQSFLCVGLDTDIEKIPVQFQSRPNGVVEFNKQIIDATKDFCVAYKINTAFYEAMGARGWDAMEETCDYIPSSHLKIADAKRADIGNTSTYYAKAFFEKLKFDAITVAPYMGEDSIRPFLDYENKWTIVLGLTSNKGANDFETLTLKNDKHLFEQVLESVSKWGNENNLMFVVGATKAESFQPIRAAFPEHFFLVPGVGAQGGSLEEVSKLALNREAGLLVNASRAIQYASSGDDFAEQAKIVATQYHEAMKILLQQSGL
jgi:orotidine-5'-phosphate decarboxylase